jgi:hypothetical protein
VSAEPNVAAREVAGTLKKEIDELRKDIGKLRTDVQEVGRDVQEERSNRLTSAEKSRERWRGTVAVILLSTLVAVMGFTFYYLVMLSSNFGELTMDEVGSVIPMVGTTLLTPLVGLIGAATGFYFGGQASAQASQDTHAAMKLVMHASQNADQQHDSQ